MSQSHVQMARQVEDDGGLQPLPPGEGPQKVTTQYATAMRVQRRRSLTEVAEQAFQEAALLGEAGYYAWGAGQDRVVGPSVGLAMCLVRVFGNCAIDTDVVETPEAWIITATFVDLETGFTLRRPFRQSKTWAVYGKFDEDRKADIRFQIGVSKATRNVILQAVPPWLRDRALDRCMGGVRETIEERLAREGHAAVVAAAVKKLETLGVDEARLLASMGRARAAALTLEDLVIIAGQIHALERDATTPEDAFPIRTEREDADDVPATARMAERIAPTVAAMVGATERSRTEQVRTTRKEELAQAQNQPEPETDPAPEPQETPPVVTGTVTRRKPAPKAAPKPVLPPIDTADRIGTTGEHLLRARLRDCKPPLTLNDVRAALKHRHPGATDLIDGPLSEWPQWLAQEFRTATNGGDA